MRTTMHVPELEGATSPLPEGQKFILRAKETKKDSKNSPPTWPLCIALYIWKEHCKGTKKGTFLSTIKGSKGTKTRANTHIPGGEAAKSSFGRVRNPSRVEREREKNFEKFTQSCPIQPPYIPPIINRTVKAREKAFQHSKKTYSILSNPTSRSLTCHVSGVRVQ